jgi:hypothetical protein
MKKIQKTPTNERRAGGGSKQHFQSFLFFFFSSFTILRVVFSICHAFEVIFCAQCTFLIANIFMNFLEALE